MAGFFNHKTEAEPIIFRAECSRAQLDEMSLNGIITPNGARVGRTVSLVQPESLDINIQELEGFKNELNLLAQEALADVTNHHLPGECHSRFCQSSSELIAQLREENEFRQKINITEIPVTLDLQEIVTDVADWVKKSARDYMELGLNQESKIEVLSKALIILNGLIFKISPFTPKA